MSASVEVEPILVPKPDECRILGGISVRTLHNLTHRENDPLPFVRMGSRIMFNLEATRAWVARQQVGKLDEPTKKPDQNDQVKPRKRRWKRPDPRSVALPSEGEQLGESPNSQVKESYTSGGAT